MNKDNTDTKPTQPEQPSPKGLDGAACSPLSAGELMDMAISGKSIPADRVLATFAEEANWVQIYHGETSPASDYEAKACEWAFIGPSRPPYELARWALNFILENVELVHHYPRGRKWNTG